MAFINKPLAIDSNILPFFDQDLEDVHSPHDDAFVVKIQIPNTLVSRILVENGSRVSVFFKDTAENMGIIDCLNKGKMTLHTFNGAPTRFLGTIKLAVQVEPYNHLGTFHVMDSSTPITPSSAEIRCIRGIMFHLAQLLHYLTLGGVREWHTVVLLLRV